MPSDHLSAGSFLDSPIHEHILSESPAEDDETRPEITHPGRVPDLSFLSANFSSESLHNDVERRDFSIAGPPVSASIAAANTIPPPGSGAFQNFPYNPKRMSFNGSNTSLSNSPTAPVGQPSFSFHQRAGSSSNGSRARPRSFMGPEPSNNPIWEYAAGSPVSETHTLNGSIDLDKPKNRNSAHFSSRRSSITSSINYIPPAEPRNPRSNSSSSSRNTSPVRTRNTSPFRQRASSPSKSQPFNFKPQDLSVPGKNGGSPSLVAKPAHRKGHRYKHSSVSMNLFQEPLPIADANQQPNLIPDSYPIPNLSESWASASRHQKLKLGLSLAHCSTSVAVFLAGVRTRQSAFSTLAHLIFYDSLGSLMASCVDIMSNFEVWGKSSIAYPFGLGRLEVLTSFALSTSSVMVGCDLISHFVEELVVGMVDPSLENTAEHGSHHIHGSGDPGISDWILYEVVLLAVIAVTWITSTYVFEQTPILKIMSADSKGALDINNTMSKKDAFSTRVKSISKILVNNPIRLLTLVYSSFLLLVPLIPESLHEQFGFDLNESSTLLVALLLCSAGWNLVKTLGGILLVSFPYSDYDFAVTRATLHDKITTLACFKAAYSIEKLHLTKANPTLYLAGVQVRMKGGSTDDESRLIFEINRIVVDTMKHFEGGCAVETTISAERV